jgi:hypothetical protein
VFVFEYVFCRKIIGNIIVGDVANPRHHPSLFECEMTDAKKKFSEMKMDWSRVRLRATNKHVYGFIFLRDFFFRFSYFKKARFISFDIFETILRKNGPNKQTSFPIIV